MPIDITPPYKIGITADMTWELTKSSLVKPTAKLIRDVKIDCTNESLIGSIREEKRAMN